jgi:hypothetical protein
MGRFNHFETESTFGKNLLKFSQKYGELIDSSFTAPTIDRLAMRYAGPIVAVPMFSSGYGQDIKANALTTIDYWHEKTNRSNIQLIHARKHIDALGNEGGSNSKNDVSDSLHSDQHSHRCMGLKGGHPDLIAWDLVEQLYNQLE